LLNNFGKGISATSRSAASGRGLHPAILLHPHQIRSAGESDNVPGRQFDLRGPAKSERDKQQGQEDCTLEPGKKETTGHTSN